MTDRPSQPARPDDPQLPPGLAGALRGLYDDAPAVPPGVDASVLRDARSGFSRRRRFRLMVRWAGAGAAAAAAVVVVAVNLSRDKAPARVAASAVVGDFDRNGRVDMLDAFVLARKVDAKGAPAPGEDVNGDGAVDRRDVDAVALMAVRLPGGGQ